MHHQSFFSQQGYGLAEILITLLLCSILLLLSVGSFSESLRRNQHESSLHQLLTELRLARSLAVNHKVVVTVCGSNDNIRCSKQWSKSLLIFSDTNRDQALQPQETLYHLSEYQRQTPWVINASAHARRIRFKPNGTAMEFGSIIDCQSIHQANSKVLVLTRSGRTRLSKMAASGSTTHACSDT